jgi:hypothetical protein
MTMFEKFDFKTVANEIDTVALRNYSNLENKFLITDTEFKLENFEQKNSIDEIKEELINKSLFFLYFETDDTYCYHLDKIINFGGKYIIHKNYNKNNYMHTSKKCKLALQATYKKKDSISHYSEIIHGNICQAIEQTKHLDGDYVEIGVYRGGSALTALNYMKYSNIKRKSYFLDTFDGFDYEEATQSSETHWEKNNEHHKLWGSQKTIEIVGNLLKSQCPNEQFELVKNNICNEPLPSSIENIVVANIDVDLYDATRDAFSKVAEKMVKGGIIIAEDPTATPALIGAFYAMEKFLKTDIGKKFMKLHLIGQCFLIKME